jgi:allophanate hydrolase subunit 2
LENDEQRDAAYRQVGQIIEEELAKVNQEVWGDRLCPKDDSVV